MKVYKIHGFFKKQMFTGAWILLEHKQQVTYVKMLQNLKRIRPDFKPVDLEDFELASLNACKQESPDAILRGCNFQFIQALLNNIKTHGLFTSYKLDTITRRWLRLFKAIPLDSLDDAIAFIEQAKPPKKR
jgi:hypothetical protein